MCISTIRLSLEWMVFQVPSKMDPFYVKKGNNLNSIETK